MRASVLHSSFGRTPNSERDTCRSSSERSSDPERGSGGERRSSGSDVDPSRVVVQQRHLDTWEVLYCGGHARIADALQQGCAELGVNFRMTSGPVLAKAGDLAAILTNLEARDVLFIDEIHRLNPVVEEVLYPALEDFELDLVIGEGPAARTVRIELQPFTLVGATTRLGLLTTPLRDRFGIPTRLNFYTIDELHEIVSRNAVKLGVPADATVTFELTLAEIYVTEVGK